MSNTNTHIVLPADKQDPVAVPACMAVGKCQATLLSSKKSPSGKKYLELHSLFGKGSTQSDVIPRIQRIRQSAFSTHPIIVSCVMSSSGHVTSFALLFLSKSRVPTWRCEQF